MRRTPSVLTCAVAGWLALASGCSGSGSGSGPGPSSPDNPATPKQPGELDKLMRTRMNASYSQLIYLVFHAEGGPDFTAISTESVKLTEAITRVLELQMPALVQSDQARQVYVDYNNTLKRDNDRFVAATAQKDIEAMSTTLTKIGDTCSACHHFFRVEIKEAK